MLQNLHRRSTRASTHNHRNTNISSIDIYGVIMVHLAYNYVKLVATLDIISSTRGRSFVPLPSELAPVLSLSSNISRLSSNCGLVHLKQFPVALETSLETISSVSSPYLSLVSKFLCSKSWSVLIFFTKYTKSPSSISISMPTIEPSFGLSIAPSTHYFTRHIDNILFLQFNTESFLLILMIIFMTMGLCYFPGSNHIPVIYLSYYIPLIASIQNICPL